MIKDKSIFDKIIDKGNIILLTLLGLTCIYPFYYIVIYALSISKETYKGVYFLPLGLTLINFKQIFQQNNIALAAFISVSRAVVGMSVTVFCTSLFAYLLAQNKIRFKKAMYRLVIFTMYVNAGLIPWYMTMKALGLKNNFLLYVLPSAIGAFYLILVKTYIEQLPPSLQESAMIDGAGPFKIFIRIVMPLCTPVLATVAIFTAVDQWNSWTDNFYLCDSKNLQTLQLLLLSYMRDQASQLTALEMLADKKVTVTPFSIRMTITVIATLPILFVYPVFQKYFVKGIMIGAIKG